jgi:hypothetical protein
VDGDGFPRLHVYRSELYTYNSYIQCSEIKY